MQESTDLQQTKLEIIEKFETLFNSYQENDYKEFNKQIGKQTTPNSFMHYMDKDKTNGNTASMKTQFAFDKFEFDAHDDPRSSLVMRIVQELEKTFRTMPLKNEKDQGQKTLKWLATLNNGKPEDGLIFVSLIIKVARSGHENRASIVRLFKQLIIAQKIAITLAIQNTEKHKTGTTLAIDTSIESGESPATVTLPPNENPDVAEKAITLASQNAEEQKTSTPVAIDTNIKSSESAETVTLPPNENPDVAEKAITLASQNAEEQKTSTPVAIDTNIKSSESAETVTLPTNENPNVAEKAITLASQYPEEQETSTPVAIDTSIESGESAATITLSPNENPNVAEKAITLASQYPEEQETSTPVAIDTNVESSESAAVTLPLNENSSVAKKENIPVSTTLISSPVGYSSALTVSFLASGLSMVGFSALVQFNPKFALWVGLHLQPSTLLIITAVGVLLAGIGLYRMCASHTHDRTANSATGMKSLSKYATSCFNLFAYGHTNPNSLIEQGEEAGPGRSDDRVVTTQPMKR